MISNRLSRPKVALTGAAVFSLLAAAPAFAQQGEPDDPPRRGWTVTLGGGAQAYPKYPGADSLGINPLPIIDFRRQGEPMPFEAPDEGWGFGLLGGDSAFNIGPAIQFQGKRRDEDVGAPVGNVGFTVEVGGFAQAMIGDNFRLRAEGRRGIGGHDGWIGDLGADFVIRDRDSYIFSIGPRVRLSDDNYQDAYFGVTPAVATATGLPVFDPDGGVHSLGAVAGLTWQFDDSVGLYTYAGYDRLVGDAADSPIVRTFGSRDQYSGGIGLFVTFDVGGGGRR